MRFRILSTFSFLFLMLLGSSLSAQLTISGTVARDNGEPVENLTIQATNAGSTVTDASGYYEFDVPVGYTGDIVPVSPLDYGNGVNWLDIMIMRAIILGIEQPTFYQLIAGDVNNTNSVTTFDYILVSFLILGQSTDFGNTDSWEYIHSETQPIDPTNPWSDLNIVPLSVENLQADETIDIVAIKIGDLDNSSSIDYNSITGTFFNDLNENCQNDDTGNLAPNWSVELEGTNNYLQVLNEDGNFVIIAPSGDYNVLVNAPNEYWESCQISYPVSIDSDTPAEIEIGTQAVVDCPLMNVYVNSFFLRPCFASHYYIDYCNMGTALAEDASVVVEFDPFLDITSTSVTPTSVDGNTYTFDLGDVDVGECGQIYVNVFLDCDATLGQAHCTEANIFPNEWCLPNPPQWSGAELELTGVCEDENVKFVVENVGADMTEAVDYIIIEDLLVKMQDQIQLNSGEIWEMETENFGTTCRMEVNQVENHPTSEHLYAFVEGCGTHPDGSISLGFVTQFPYNNDEPFTFIHCEESRSSWDPNDITGFPLGYDEEHFIDRDIPMEYLIRFQNTGNDTAFNVRIENPLAEGLDWSTMRPIGSSHEYIPVFEEDKLVFYFPEIMLPDSNVNEVSSHGFIRYSIEQSADIELGDVIENQVGIYFDFNEPVLTNIAMHTIAEPLITVEATEIFIENVSIDYYPNPVENQLTIDLKTDDFRTGQLEIYDAVGKLVQVEKFENHALTINTQHLQSGLYFFKVAMNGQAAASGKIIKQ